MAGRPEPSRRWGRRGGGGEEEILGEGVLFRVPVRLVRVPVRWEVVRVRLGADLTGGGPHALARWEVVVAEGRR
jgi:hypothetical protein